MSTIHIYTASTDHHDAQVTATTPSAWAVILCYDQHQKALTDGGYGQTEAALTLTAIIHALKMLKRHDLPIHIHTTSPVIAEHLTKQHYLTWRQENWQLADKPLEDLQLWQELVPLIESCPDIIFTYHDNADKIMTTATMTLSAVMTKL
ncbi:RNase H family protein [Lactiplantibacillus herbarum]|uniref:RNase H family protein n=1 Tax=Lactiplantibacillus herbarum TaxID=1670446 RepID=UPI00064EC10D|nr:RNase H family protein [Lactiplantibacillus herbarum]